MQSIELNKIAPILREGHFIFISASNGSYLIADARNDDPVSELRTLKNLPPDKGFRILIDSDARLNRIVPDVPALAWDIIDTADEAMILILKGGKNISKNALAEDGTIAVQMATRKEEVKLVQSANCPLLITEVDIEELPENFSSVDYVINLPAPIFKRTPSRKLPIIFLGSGNEVRVIRE
jgi:L-threonylcarbamoyladenylate synthase